MSQSRKFLRFHIWKKMLEVAFLFRESIHLLQRHTILHLLNGLIWNRALNYNKTGDLPQTATQLVSRQVNVGVTTSVFNLLQRR
jgi:hypothetical protein